MKTNDIRAMLGLLMAARLANAPAEITDTTITVWGIALDDVTTEAASTAVKDIIRTEKWFPQPATIRERALDAQGHLLSPEEAWKQVQPSEYARAQPHHVTLAALKDIGGIWAVKTSEKPEKTRESFMQAYAVRLQEAREAIAARNTTDHTNGQIERSTGQIRALEERA